MLLLFVCCPRSNGPFSLVACGSRLFLIELMAEAPRIELFLFCTGVYYILLKLSVFCGEAIVAPVLARDGGKLALAFSRWIERFAF